MSQPGTALQRANEAAVQKANNAEASIKDLVRQNWSAVEGALPETMDSKRFARLVFNAVRKTPKLADCSGISMIGSLLAASSIGVEVNTPLGKAYLIPYGSEATFIMGYQGYVRLFRQHPDADDVATGWIGSKDKIDYSYGRNKHLDHKPNMLDRGDCIGVWALYTLKSGAWDFVVLTMDQVKALRGKGEGGDVRDPEHWLARKTALRQVLKLAPKSTALAAAVAADEQSGRDAAQAAGLADNLMAPIPAVNMSTVHGEIEAAPEHIDEATGEVLDQEPAADPEPATPAAKPLTRTTGNAVLAEFKRLGVDAAEVDAWLPALGIPVSLAQLSQPDAEELLGVLRGLDRDRLAELGREAGAR